MGCKVFIVLWRFLMDFSEILRFLLIFTSRIYGIKITLNDCTDFEKKKNTLIVNMYLMNSD